MPTRPKRALQLTTLTGGLLMLGLLVAGCSVDAKPSGQGFKNMDAGGGQSGNGGAPAPKDAGKDATMAMLKDAGHKPSKIDAGHAKDAGKPVDDGGHLMPDAGFDAGPPVIPPPQLITHFSAGGRVLSAASGTKKLTFTLGAFGPSHSVAVPTGVSASENYPLSAGLKPPTP